MNEQIREQIAIANEVADLLAEEYDCDALTTVDLLDVLATLGYRLVPMGGANVASHAYFELLRERT
jgi:hypothetical protein